MWKPANENGVLQITRKINSRKFSQSSQSSQENKRSFFWWLSKVPHWRLAETLNPAPAVRAVFCVAVNQRRAPLREDKRRDDGSAAWCSKSFCFFHSRSHGGQQRRARQVTTFTHQSFLLHLLP